MRIWLKPDRLSQLKLHDRRGGAGDHRAERPVRRRQDRPDADRRAAGARLHDQHEGPAGRGRRVREHRRALEPRRLEPAAEGHRARRARLEGLRVHRPRERARGDARRRLPPAGGERPRGRPPRERNGRGACGPLSRRAHPVGRLRHDAVRQGVDPRGGDNARRGDAARLPRRLSLPAKLPRDADPSPGGPGLAHRDVRRAPLARLLDQHADPLRHGARHRHRRRRRDRRARERRADHARGAPLGARVGDQGDAGGHEPDHRDRPRPVRGVRADRVPGRSHGRAVPPVRGHDLDRRGDLRPGRADADPGAVRDDPQARCAAAEPILPRLQRLVRPRDASLRARGRLDDPARGARPPALRRDGRDHGRAVADHAGLARARRGPGLLHRGGHPARRRDAGAHRQGREPGRGHHQVEPGQRERGRVHRLRFPRRRVPQQRGDDLRHAEALGRAERPGAGAGRRALDEDRPHQGGARPRVRSAADLRPRERRGLRALHPEPRRGRLEAPVGGHAGVHRARGEGPGVRAGEHAVASEHAAALRQRGPRAREGGRRAARRSLRHRRRDARHLLRQRLQPLRSHVAGADVRRPAVPQVPEDIGGVWMRGAKGDMVPLGALADVRYTSAPRRSTGSTTCPR